MFQSEIKTSGFDTKVETFPATGPPLPGTNNFIQSRRWTGCTYHLAQSWVCCWLFGYWERKLRGFSFITTLQGDSVWQYCWPGRTGAQCALQHLTLGSASPQVQHWECLQQKDGGCAAKRSPWVPLCKSDISVSLLRRLKVRKGMVYYLISFPDFLLLFWAIYTFKNAQGKQTLFSLVCESLSFALLNHEGKPGVISRRFSARTRGSGPNTFHGLSVWVSALLARSEGEERINA